MVVLTDLTPTVLGWLGRAPPAASVGAQITRGDRGSADSRLAATVQSLAGRDTAEQVWTSTHDEFFWAYALANAVVLAAIGLACWGAAEDKRRQRARGWRVAGVFAASVPAGAFPGRPGAVVDLRPSGRRSVCGLGGAGHRHRPGSRCSVRGGAIRWRRSAWCACSRWRCWRWT